jgi:SAM-dependent methyltransferase
MDPVLLELCRCPKCGGSLEEPASALRCAGCRREFPRLGGVPCLFANPEAEVARWSRRLARYLADTEQSAAAMRQQLAQFVLLPSTRGRLERLLAANERNAECLVALFRAAGLAAATDGSQHRDPVVMLDASPLGLVDDLPDLFRDWSDDPDAAAENARALELVLAALGPSLALGRALVLGAGAGRLAYDLARACRPAFTVALEINPLLVLAAERVLFHDGLRLVETPAVPDGIASVCVERELRTPSGPPANFQLVLADAFAAPFGAGRFDTVVTPWFVDAVPADACRTLSVIHRLLAPGGRWIHYGPLRYPPGRPAVQRYTPEEFFELSALAGFELANPRVTRVDHLRSSANARRHSERALVSVATRVDPPHASSSGVPTWLLFPHVPIPRLTGLDRVPEHPVVLPYVARQIDGKATAHDIAERLIADHGARPDMAIDGTRALLAVLYRLSGATTGQA